MQTVGGSLPLLIYAIWGAKAECQIINRTGLSCAFLPDSMRFTDVTVWVCRWVFQSYFKGEILRWLISGWSYLLWIIFYIVLIQATEVLGMVGALDKSVFGSLLSKSWPIALWTQRMAEGFAGCSPALPRRWPTLEQHFTADVFCSGRQDICLKRSNYDNTSKSSNSFQWGTGIWHWQHQCEAPTAITAICLKIWHSSPVGWKEGLPKPILSSPFSSSTCRPQRC